jgi:hypothetical protein
MTEPMYLIWSNDAGAWWGPGGHGYRANDLWHAGRFTREDAIARCSIRTWPSANPKPALPPEVMIPAPENGGATFTAEQLRDMPRVITAQVTMMTSKAMEQRERERLSCRWCASGGEPDRSPCKCGFRCGYGGCCSYENPAADIFYRLTAPDRHHAGLGITCTLCAGPCTIDDEKAEATR